MLEFLSSVFGGGVTGLLGILVQRVADHQAKKLEMTAAREKMAHEVALREADARIMAQEFAARTQVAQVEAAGREAVADAAAFAASFSEPQRYSDRVAPTAGQGWALVLLDLVRGLVRPGLTVYLCAVTTLIYYQARSMSVSATPAEAAELLRTVVNTVLYLTTTCVLWWFGTRNKQAAPR